MGDHQERIELLQKQLGGVHKQFSDLKVAYSGVEKELDDQKEANVRAPTTTMKQLVERLKNQLTLKEKQHQVSCTRNTFGNEWVG